MTLSILLKISFNISTKYRKKICFHSINCISLGQCLSTRAVNLSYLKLLPDEVTNRIPVIILHGFLGSKQNWRGLAKSISKKSGRQVYLLDARNHGDSPHTNNFSYNLMCEDVKHFMHSQAIPSAVFVGHSMSGRTVMKLALTEKEMVDKLVVVDVSPIKMPKSSSVFIPAYMVAMKESIASLNNIGIVQARKLVDEYLAQSIPEVSIRQFLLTNLVEKDNKIQWKPNIDVLHKTFQSEICDFSQFVGYYLGDTVFICGKDSPYVKEEDYSPIRELFPKAEFIIIPGAGHWVHSEKPSEFLKAICNFL